MSVPIFLKNMEIYSKSKEILLFFKSKKSKMKYILFIKYVLTIHSSKK